MLIDFNINFQHGDFITPDSSWLSTLIITIIGSLISILGSLKIFQLTIKQDKEKEELKQKQYRKDKLIYLQLNYIKATKKIKAQINHIPKFIQDLENDPFTLPRLSMATLDDVYKLNDALNQEDMFHVYIREFGYSIKSYNEFNSLSSTINYINAQLKLTIDGLAKSMDFDYERKIQYSQLLEAVLDKAAKLLKVPQGEINATAMQIISDTMILYFENKTDHSGVDYAQNAFVIKLRNGLLPHAIQSEVIVDILRLLKDLTHLHSNIQMQNEGVKEDFVNDLKGLTTAYKDILRHGKSLSNLRLLNII